MVMYVGSSSLCSNLFAVQGIKNTKKGARLGILEGDISTDCRQCSVVLAPPWWEKNVCNE